MSNVDVTMPDTTTTDTAVGGYSHYYTSVEVEQVFVDAPDTLSFMNLLRPMCPDVKPGRGPHGPARRKIVPLPSRARSSQSQSPAPALTAGSGGQQQGKTETRDRECEEQDSGEGESDDSMRIDDPRTEEYDCSCESPVTPGLVNDEDDDSDCDSVCFVYSDSDEDVSAFSSNNHLRRKHRVNSRASGPVHPDPSPAAESSRDSAVHLFQSITATPGPGSWSFEELRHECYAQSRVATGTGPAAITPGAPAWMVIPPAFAPRAVGVRDASCPNRDAGA